MAIQLCGFCGRRLSSDAERETGVCGFCGRVPGSEREELGVSSWLPETGIT